MSYKSKLACDHKPNISDYFSLLQCGYMGGIKTIFFLVIGR